MHCPYASHPTDRNCKLIDTKPTPVPTNLARHHAVCATCAAQTAALDLLARSQDLHHIRAPQRRLLSGQCPASGSVYAALHSSVCGAGAWGVCQHQPWIGVLGRARSHLACPERSMHASEDMCGEQGADCVHAKGKEVFARSKQAQDYMAEPRRSITGSQCQRAKHKQ